MTTTDQVSLQMSTPYRQYAEALLDAENQILTSRTHDIIHAYFSTAGAGSMQQRRGMTDQRLADGLQLENVRRRSSPGQFIS